MTTPATPPIGAHVTYHLILAHTCEGRGCRCKPQAFPARVYGHAQIEVPAFDRIANAEEIRLADPQVSDADLAAALAVRRSEHARRVAAIRATLPVLELEVEFPAEHMTEQQHEARPRSGPVKCGVTKHGYMTVQTHCAFGGDKPESGTWTPARPAVAASSRA